MPAESKEVRPYHYFDTPDGHDLDKKLVAVMKPTVLSALAIATCDVMLHSHPKGYINTLGRYAYIALPIIGMGVAFVATTNAVCSIRHKDDEWNWVAGGLAAGGIFGAWRKSGVAGTSMALALGFAGAVKKNCHRNGYKLIPDEIRAAHGGANWVRHDFTMYNDVQGTWKKV